MTEVELFIQRNLELPDRDTLKSSVSIAIGLFLKFYSRKTIIMYFMRSKMMFDTCS